MAIKFLNTVAVDTDVLFVDTASDRVGIGTTSPNKKLEVSAAADTTISIASSDTSINVGQNIGILEFASNNETSLSQAYTPFSKIKTISESAVTGTGSVNGAITFETARVNIISERMRITSAGNVGIGVTSPGAKLEASTDAEMVAKFAGNTDDGGGYVGAIVEIESNSDVRGRGVYLTHRNSADTDPSEWYAGVPYTGGGYSIGNAAYGTSVNSNTGPAHKDQSKVFIEESGDVGIGTTLPGRQLTLSGNSSPIISLKSNTTGGEPSIYFGDTADDNEGRIVYSNSQDAMQIWTAAAERIRVTSVGDTGIGVQVPKAKLDVDGGVKIGDDTDTASADKEGTLRYHVSGGYAKLDICMQESGVGGYAWFNVLRISMSI